MSTSGQKKISGFRRFTILFYNKSRNLVGRKRGKFSSLNEAREARNAERKLLSAFWQTLIQLVFHKIYMKAISSTRKINENFFLTLCQNSFTKFKFLHQVQIPSPSSNSFTKFKFLDQVQIPSPSSNSFTMFKFLHQVQIP